MAEELVLGLVQMRASASKSQNLEAAREGIRIAASGGAQLVCLQELFATAYFCQSEDAECFELAEPLPGPTYEAISSTASDCNVSVLGSFFERRGAGLYHNTAVLFAPNGREVVRYRKMHIPDDPQFYEKYYFAPGDLGYPVGRVAGARVAPLICWDQWYPEPARLVALQGAQIIVYPTAIGWLPEEKVEYGTSQLDAWRTIQRSHAIANGAFVVAINRVGFEASPDPQSAPAKALPSRAASDDTSHSLASALSAASREDASAARERGIEFWGHSFVANPFGEVVAEAGESEEVLVVRCELEQQEHARRGWPFLRDRRIDSYARLTERFIDG